MTPLPPDRIAAMFERCRAEQRLALVGYLPLGDPRLAGQEDALAARMVDAGVDILELGLAWRRPALDGAVIAQAQRRALDAGYTLARFFRDSARIRRRVEAPLVLMTYFEQVLLLGIEALAAPAGAGGFDAVLFPDCPAPARPDVTGYVAQHGVRTVRFLSTSERPWTLAPAPGVCCGYIQAAGGLTGVAVPDFDVLSRRLTDVRSVNHDLPLLCGIGIRSPRDVARLAALGADGVVVATALVERMNDPGRLARFIGELRAAGSPRLDPSYPRSRADAST